MSPSGRAAAGPTRPANPNPQPADHQSPPRKVVTPLGSTNQTFQQGMASATGTAKKRSHGTLKEQMEEARKLRRLNNGQEQIRKVNVPVAEVSRVAHATSAITTNGTRENTKTCIGRKPKQSGPTSNCNAKPTKLVPVSSTLDKGLSLVDRMLRKAKEERIARDAEKTKSADSRREKNPDTQRAVKEKRKVAYDDDSEEDQPDLKRPRHDSVTSAVERPAESPLQFASARERRRIERQQRYALKAIKSANRSPESESAAALPRNDPSHRIASAARATSGYNIRTERTTGPKAQLSNEYSKPKIADRVIKVSRKLRGSRVQPGQVELVKPSPQGTERTGRSLGKSPAVKSNSISDSDSDSELDVEVKLTPAAKQRQEREKKRELLAARKEKQLARQAGRTTSNSRSASTQTTVSPVASSRSSRSSSPQRAASTPPSPVAGTDAVVKSGPGSIRSRSSSAESLGSSDSVKTTRSAIGRKFFKD